jgi:3-oxoacyl-[acyl-carrier-protein] synthase-3
MTGKECFARGRQVTDVIKRGFRGRPATPPTISTGSCRIRPTSALSTHRRKAGHRAEKVVTTVDLHGNTSAASIPLALDAAVKDGRIKRGDLVMMEAMGGGFTWGAALIRW